jgi:hypothetical protein
MPLQDILVVVDDEVLCKLQRRCAGQALYHGRKPPSKYKQSTIHGMTITVTAAFKRVMTAHTQSNTLEACGAAIGNAAFNLRRRAATVNPQIFQLTR